jgi:hypothetical protein
MYRSTAAPLLALALALAPAAGNAGDVYVGAKAGPMLVDISGADDPTNVGLTLGYQLGVLVGDIAIEGEYTTSLDDGQVSGAPVEVDTLGLFLALRTAGPVYFKARGGVASVDTTVGASDSSKSGIAYGLGLGFGIGVAQLELEYTVMEGDTHFVSLGGQF